MTEKTGYLGPEESYSRLAAEKLCGGSELIPYEGFYGMFKALERGEVDSIVLPIKNTVNGAVTQNLDLMEEAQGVVAVARCRLRIDHRLATLAGADTGKIKDVYSHPQALAQCSEYLAENFPSARLHETSSTAEGLKKIRCATDAAIVGAHVAEEGIALSEQTVSDEKENYTTFLKVVKGGLTPGEGLGESCFFCFTLRNETGALCGALNVLVSYGINLTDIESRPIKNHPGRIRFFIEIDCSAGRGNVEAALKELKNHTLSFKMLGAY